VALYTHSTPSFTTGPRRLVPVVARAAVEAHERAAAKDERHVKLDNGLHAAEGCAPRPRRRLGPPLRGPAPRSGPLAARAVRLAYELPARATPERAAARRRRRVARCRSNGRLSAVLRARHVLHRPRGVGMGRAGGRRELGAPRARRRWPRLRRRQGRHRPRGMTTEPFAPAADLTPIRARSSHATPHQDSGLSGRTNGSNRGHRRPTLPRRPRLAAVESRDHRGMV
jgi:hypothetical protein